MIRAFIDSSVLFAASYSSTGASCELIQWAIRGQLTLVISHLVVAETERNITNKAPDSLADFQLFLSTVDFEFVRPTKREVITAQKYTELKDAPIVAAATRAQTDYLVTLDDKHLLSNDTLQQSVTYHVIRPGELLSILRKGLDKK